MTGPVRAPGSPGPPAPVPAPREWKALARQAADANDRVLRNLVATLDGLEHRGEADRLLEPARPRLRHLRPARPIRFGRLLFLPLNGVIVPASRWRRGMPLIPRSTLPALAHAVRIAMAEEAEAIIAEARGQVFADHAAVASLGGRLWPRAAGLLPAAAPPGWAGVTGLNDADYATIAGLLAPVLRQGAEIHAAMAAAAEGPPEELVRAALAPLGAAGAPGPLKAALQTLLQVAVLPGRVIAAASSLGPAARSTAMPMLQDVLDQPAPTLGELDLAAATRTVLDLAGQWGDLDTCGLLDGTQRRQLRALRHAADRAARERLREGFDGEVLGPLDALRRTAAEAGGVAPDAAIRGVEAAARRLRGLAQAARHLDGEGPPPERILQAATPQLQALLAGCSAGGATAMDLARLVEILDGPEAGVALLQGCAA